MNFNEFDTILKKFVETHFNKSIDESRLLKAFFYIIRNNIKPMIEKDLSEDIIHSLFVKEVANIDNFIYSHSMIIRTRYTILNVDEFITFLKENSIQYRLSELFFDPDEWLVYDQLISDYMVWSKSFRRKSPLNPATIETVFSYHHENKLFEKLVCKWFPQASSKLLIEALSYSLSWWYCIPERNRELVLNFNFLSLPSNICGLVLLMCYCKNIDLVPVANFGFLLQCIENGNNNNTLSELMTMDESSFLKLMIGVGKRFTGVEKMGTKNYDLQEQVLKLSKDMEAIKKNYVTNIKFSEINGKLIITEEELRTTKAELRASQEELRNTKDEVRASQEELRNTKEQLRVTQEELRNLKGELRVTQEELRNTKDEVRATQEELRNTKEQLRVTQEELRETKEKLKVVEKKLFEEEISLCIMTSNFKTSKLSELNLGSLIEHQKQVIIELIRIGEERESYYLSRILELEKNINSCMCGCNCVSCNCSK